MNGKIITFGEIMLRLSKPEHYRIMQGNTFNGNYGGSEANVAVSLSMLGDDVEYVTRQNVPERSPHRNVGIRSDTVSSACWSRAGSTGSVSVTLIRYRDA